MRREATRFGSVAPLAASRDGGRAGDTTRKRPTACLKALEPPLTTQAGTADLRLEAQVLPQVPRRRGARRVRAGRGCRHRHHADQGARASGVRRQVERSGHRGLHRELGRVLGRDVAGPLGPVPRGAESWKAFFGHPPRNIRVPAVSPPRPASAAQYPRPRRGAAATRLRRRRRGLSTSRPRRRRDTF